MNNKHKKLFSILSILLMILLPTSLSIVYAQEGQESGQQATPPPESSPVKTPSEPTPEPALQPEPTQAAPYIPPASPAYNSYSGGGSGGGPGPLDTGEVTPQAATDVQLVADEKKPEAKSNTGKILLAVGGLAAVGGLTYYLMPKK